MAGRVMGQVREPGVGMASRVVDWQWGHELRLPEWAGKVLLGNEAKRYDIA